MPAFQGEHRNDRWQPFSPPAVDAGTGCDAREVMRPAEGLTCQPPIGSVRDERGTQPSALALRTAIGIKRKSHMRIVDIRERSVPLKSNIANSSFDFSEMTTSVVAVITDIVRDGRPVAGFAFNSTGRYACGARMRERFIPRIRAAKPDAQLDADGNLDPAKILACMMQREKAGGHSE